MTRRLILTICTVALAIAVAGCDFPQFRDNIIEYKGSEFQVASLYVVDRGLNGSGYDVGFYLTEDALTIDSNGDLSGSGTYIYTEAHLASDTIQEGDYSWNSETQRMLLLIHEGGIQVNYPNGPALVPITFGNLVIELDELTSDWITEFTLQSPDAEIVGYYRGVVTNTISATN